jgi:hypothetical protein
MEASGGLEDDADGGNFKERRLEDDAEGGDLKERRVGSGK